MNRQLWYKHGEYRLGIENATGSIYKGESLLFRGFSYTAITMFIEYSGNNPDVMDKFRTQLEMRQKLLWNEKQETAKWDHKNDDDRQKGKKK